MGKTSTKTVKTAYKNRQEMQHEVLVLADIRGWRFARAKGDELIIRR